MAEELNKAAAKPVPAKPQQPAQEPESGTWQPGGEIPFLMENIGIFIDSTLKSITDMVTTATNVTTQAIDSVNNAVTSDAVTGMVDTITSSTGKAIDNINAALGSQELKNSIDQLGSTINNVTTAIGDTINAPQVQEFFDNIGNSVTQIVTSATQVAQPSPAPHAKAVEIQYTRGQKIAREENSSTVQAAAVETPMPEIPAPEPARQASSSTPSGKEEPMIIMSSSAAPQKKAPPPGREAVSKKRAELENPTETPWRQ